jgi:hypothetical protein
MCYRNRLRSLTSLEAVSIGSKSSWSCAFAEYAALEGSSSLKVTQDWGEGDSVPLNYIGFRSRMLLEFHKDSGPRLCDAFMLTLTRLFEGDWAKTVLLVNWFLPPLPPGDSRIPSFFGEWVCALQNNYNYGYCL